ncbi:carbon-nitrogen hydrolase family protein [Variovorax saccharolyticus]|uniref:carbon-nitrogen hydrolase family protein n=1 Tax=Variovorax saccharolyticus TaxID=3053516 RepID=UPI00257528ED|nr:carbon-nitrogen hydrolase family protein [Variovorax sp. J22R187]MDM0018257.1 carbon-nitrogen hydrolase family protein [Variovorax sp. J22R187]
MHAAPATSSTEPAAPWVAAVVQAAPCYLDLEASVDKAIDLIAHAARSGARLVAFPELWLPGYPWWVWLAPAAWAADHGFDRRYAAQAMQYGTPAADRLAAAARAHRIMVVMGLAERDGDALYIGQWLIDDSGRTVGRRRKLKPGPLERRVFAEGSGAGDLQVYPTAVGRVGALCCAEHRNPLFKYALHQQNEEVHVAAWPSFSVRAFAAGLSADTYLALSRSYAAEGGCYVLAPCAPVDAATRDLVCDTDEKAAQLGLGGGHAQVFAPNGDPLCTPLAPDAEGLLLATIDPARIAGAKAAHDIAGHSARLDVVGLAWAHGTKERP